MPAATASSARYELVSTSARPAGDPAERRDLLDHALERVVGARVGQAARQVEQRLRAEVVRRADRDLVAPRAGRAARGRSRTRSPAVSVAETRIAVGPSSQSSSASARADVDRRPGEQVGLGPDDAVAVVGLEARGDVGGQPQRPLGDGVDLVAASLERGGELAEPRGERRGRLGGHLAQPPPARSAARPPRSSRRPARLDAVERAGRRGHGRLAAGAVDVAEQPVDARAR